MTEDGTQSPRVVQREGRPQSSLATPCTSSGFAEPRSWSRSWRIVFFDVLEGDPAGRQAGGQRRDSTRKAWSVSIARAHFALSQLVEDRGGLVVDDAFRCHVGVPSSPVRPAGHPENFIRGGGKHGSPLHKQAKASPKDLQGRSFGRRTLFMSSGPHEAVSMSFRIRGIADWIDLRELHIAVVICHGCLSTQLAHHLSKEREKLSCDNAGLTFSSAIRTLARVQFSDETAISEPKSVDRVLLAVLFRVPNRWWSKLISSNCQVTFSGMAYDRHGAWW